MSSTTNKLHVHNIELTTLSPLFIGTDQAKVLSPYTDFVVVGNKVTGFTLKYINKEKFKEVLMSQPEKIDEFTRLVRASMNESNTASEFSLRDFIEKGLRIPIEDLTETSKAIPDDTKHNGIDRFICNAGKPYIPGSTIKGAIRTALLYDWLCNTKNGTITLGEIKKIIDDYQGEKPDKKKKKELLYYKEQVKCFGDIKWDVLKYLRISDTYPLSKDILTINKIQSGISFTKRKSIRNTDAIPVWAELLPAGVTLKCSFTILPKVQGDFNWLNKNDAVETLLGKVYEFSKVNLERELSVFESGENINVPFYEEHSDNKFTPRNVILRIGRGKTYYDNSIALALKKMYGGKLMTKFLNMIVVEKSIDDEMNFPSTRSFVMEKNNFVPLGWVKMSCL